MMIFPPINGTPVWAVLLTIYENDEDKPFATTSCEVLAVAASEAAARDTARAHEPHLSYGAHLMIQETVMVDPE